MLESHAFGRIAEDLAVHFFIEKGYTILERNYRYQYAEVDIIVRKDNTVVAVEVKARSSVFYGDPQSFVNRKKIKLMIMALDHYIVDKNLTVEARCDILAVVKQNEIHELQHFEDAFYYF